TIEQVWFAGVHSNIGGGYRDCGLANIALDWLAGRSARHGLQFTDSIAGMQCEAADRCRLEDSFSWSYQALRALRVRPYQREIGPKQGGDIRPAGTIVPGESAHPSAVEAIGKHFARNPGNAHYEPKNLISALDDGLPVWQET
ncbi:MAG: DUF2235 domain-containing protein, partial [Gammaproteobacteria bacterium]|nr:DUF2235 domain-containing protein [Gammaproteobacteria bacterium]